MPHSVAPKVRDTFLPFAKPDTDRRETDVVSQVIALGWLTTEPKTRDEVITTTMTFAATAKVVDINIQRGAVDVQQIEDAVTERTKAIIPVHVAGQAADLEAVHQIADKHGMTVIEDALMPFPRSTKIGSVVGSVISPRSAFTPRRPWRRAEAV